MPFWRELWYVANYAFCVLFLKSKTCVCAILLRFSISVKWISQQSIMTQTSGEGSKMVVLETTKNTYLLQVLSTIVGLALWIQLVIYRLLGIWLKTLLIWAGPALDIFPASLEKWVGETDWACPCLLHIGTAGHMTRVLSKWCRAAWCHSVLWCHDELRHRVFQNSCFSWYVIATIHTL